MNNLALFYAAFAMVTLAVLLNRYWRRRIRRIRRDAEIARERVEETRKEITAVAAKFEGLAGDLDSTEARTETAASDIETLARELETLKNASMDRYYIFDRLEPRQGRFWEATIRQPRADKSRPDWNGRRYILVAENEREARRKVAARFPRQLGYEETRLVPCRIAGLSVNRVNESSSTFKRPDADKAQ